MTSSYDLSVKIDEKSKECEIASNALFIVEQEILVLQRQIIELQGKKKDLELAASKGKQNLRILNNELQRITREFWRYNKTGA